MVKVNSGVLVMVDAREDATALERAVWAAAVEATIPAACVCMAEGGS